MVKNFYKVLKGDTENKLNCNSLELQSDFDSKQKLKITKERVFGSAKGKYQLADDFDVPLGDFKDYM
jgi:hypothetical protein